MVALLPGARAAALSTDPAQLDPRIPKGSTFVLNREPAIQTRRMHATLQYGKVTTNQGPKGYQLDSQFDMKQLGPRTTQPEAPSCRGSSSSKERIAQAAGLLRKCTDVFLDSEKSTDAVALMHREQGHKDDANRQLDLHHGIDAA